ncbi:hypothetical protein V6N00_13145 [Tersicoccus sp. MR15.9]|uniref:hypothetical protein n=1 Tax=Tersicoccus mangrovi TaxID=3121635 RepID=UPI002FE68C60
MSTSTLSAEDTAIGRPMDLTGLTAGGEPVARPWGPDDHDRLFPDADALVEHLVTVHAAGQEEMDRMRASEAARTDRTGVDQTMGLLRYVHRLARSRQAVA